MNEKEIIIKNWFSMWLNGKDSGIKDIFAEHCTYIESWGPEYSGNAQIIQWFNEWNARGKVVKWNIKQFFHKDNQTIVEWEFKNIMSDGTSEEFDGLSLVRWDSNNKITFLKEFGCNISTYNPYSDGNKPVFKDDKVRWF